ncbi:multiple stress resistance protein BhsA [Serratia sp. UGAL515B_01]|uniref:multiple stress resistance protein BhsA n=1 Tax=Serratia sp. UGAL515B_01 TaxID=2986763 RepID=UPI002954C5DE|nr:YdgH/BhsA/McbA-like domain containing protein [Serratia sp. UGAL515B_01]WON78696.1 DUF1471 domain-containing protein [Serratia sp. UGAL515B_01]
MKNIKYTAAVITLALTSFTAFAAVPVDMQKAMTLTESGVITAGHATTLASLEADLAAKAKAQGASSYRVVSVNGNNLIHGSAIIYK